MSEWNLSVVLIVPALMQTKANYLSCALGYDEMPGNTYKVPLSANGELPITHYGCRTAATEDFADILQNAGAGNLPGGLDLAAFNLTVEDVQDIMGALIYDVRPATQMTNHFPDVCAANNLARYFPPEEDE